jgi:hypothetical protein
MASAALLDDRLQIDGVNMYTATNTFGVPAGGFYKDPMDGGYTTQISESRDDDDNSPSDLDEHFNPVHLNRAGAMYLNGGGLKPVPDGLYPARKIQYDNGATSWVRYGAKLMHESRLEPVDWLLVAMVGAILFFTISRSLKR